MITIYTVAYNEELQLPFFINHYRVNFPGCDIVVYDNMSTDNTVDIAKKNNCEVISYDTGNKISDSKYLQIKNNCWKSANTDWVAVCDVDEILEINEQDLKKEKQLNTSIITFNGYNMINMNDDSIDLSSINYGDRSTAYDKMYIFDKSNIQEINYNPGCHTASPIGNIRFSERQYGAYHYNFIDVNLSLEKYRLYASRLSEENIKNGWGKHYFFTEEQIRQEFNDIRSKARKLF